MLKIRADICPYSFENSIMMSAEFWSSEPKNLNVDAYHCIHEKPIYIHRPNVLTSLESTITYDPESITPTECAHMYNTHLDPEGYATEKINHTTWGTRNLLVTSNTQFGAANAWGVQMDNYYVTKVQISYDHHTGHVRIFHLNDLDKDCEFDENSCWSSRRILVWRLLGENKGYCSLTSRIASSCF